MIKVKKCPKCGKECRARDNFCPRCHYQFNSVMPSRMRRNRRYHHKSHIIPGLIIAGMCVAIGVGGTITLQRMTSQPSHSQTSRPAKSSSDSSSDSSSSSQSDNNQSDNSDSSQSDNSDRSSDNNSDSDMHSDVPGHPSDSDNPSDPNNDRHIPRPSDSDTPKIIIRN